MFKKIFGINDSKHESDEERDLDKECESDEQCESDEECDSDEECESDFDEEKSQDIRYMFNKFDKFKNSENRDLYQIPISVFIQYRDRIDFSDNNRMINNERIKNGFKNFDVGKCDPIILAISDNEKDFEKNKFYIIDGQHRCHLIFTNPGLFNGDENIIVDIRHVNNVEEFKEQLNIVNNRLNFTDSQLNKFKLQAIKDDLEEKLGSDIFGKNRPKINWNKLSSKLVNLPIYNEFSYDAKFISNKLMELNRKLATTIFDEETMKKLKLSQNILVNCSKKNLFLGIDKEYRILDLLKC